MDFLRKLFGRLNSQPPLPPPAPTTRTAPPAPPGQATRTSPIERPFQSPRKFYKPRTDLDLNSVYPSGAVIAGRYEVVQGPREKPSLAGGMGLVYLCRDQQQDFPVALKTFQPQYLSDRHKRDLFLNEGNTWVNLGKHPHIVHAYTVAYIGDGREVYLALELVAGAEGKDDASLRQWLIPGHPLPLEQILLFALHIARGMKHVTTTIPGLTHRDLKPENVLVGRDELARVTDFGLASTQAQVSGGTPLYMAPEQQRGEQVDARADIYALGLMVYEMVTGISTDELWQARKDGQMLELLYKLPTEVRILARHCLAPECEKRYTGWGEVEAAITEAYQKVMWVDAPDEITGEAQTRADRVAAGWSYTNLGISFKDIGKAEVAAGYFERVIQTGRAEAESELEWAGLSNLGMAYRVLGYERRAIEFFEQGLTIARKIGDRRAEGQTLGCLGTAYLALRDARRAIKFIEQDLTIAREIGDRREEGGALGNLGGAYFALGDARRAIEFYEQALMIAREIGDRRVEDGALGNLGNAYRALGDARRAIEFWEQALMIAREIGDQRGEGMTLDNLGNAYQALGDARRAIEFWEQALTITREIGDRRTEGITLGNLGVAYYDLGDARRTGEFFDQALTMAREIGDWKTGSIVLFNMSIAVDRAGDRPLAIRLAQEALKIFEQIGSPKAAQARKQLVEWGE